MLGIDVVNDGEHSKSSFVAYPDTRLGGFQPTDRPLGSRAVHPRRARLSRRL